MSEVLLSSRRHGLQWGLADVVVDPWRPGSAAGRVFGGIREFPSLPAYFRERRSERGHQLTMNRKGRSPGPRPPREECHQLAYYLGPLHRHFGHAIVETVPRLWFYQEANTLLGAGEPLPLVVLPPADNREHLRHFEAGDLSEWQRQLLRLYGVPTEVVRFVRCAVRYSRLIVAEQAWLWGAKPTQEAAAASLPPGSPRGASKADERIYLVRPDEYFRRGAVAGERMIREFFRENGYRLVDPVTFSLPEQVELVRGASQVFGVQGSAFHLFNLAGNSTVRIGCLGRMGALATRGFVNSLEPFVGALLFQRPDGSETSPDPSIRGTKYRLALHREVPRLLEFLKRFDPSLATDRFDAQAYERAIEADLEAFRSGSQAG